MAMRFQCKALDYNVSNEITMKYIDIRWMYGKAWDICSRHDTYYTTDI